MVSVLILLCCVTIGIAESAAAYRIQQYIAPLECVVDDLNDGSNTTTILSPEDCSDYFEEPDTPDLTVDSNTQTVPISDTLKIKSSNLTITPSQISKTDIDSVSNPDIAIDQPHRDIVKDTQSGNNTSSILDKPIELIVIALSLASLSVLNWRHIALIRKYWYNQR